MPVVLSQVAICVCTYRNPGGLKLLLDGLNLQTLTTVGDRDVCIVVVDNDDAHSAADVIAGYRETGRFRLVEVRQPARGLSSARNAALDAADVKSSTYFAFLDDDEVPEPVWLQTLLDAFAETERSIVVGPVEARFVSAPPEWVLRGGFFRKPAPLPGQHHDGYTSNVMIRTACWRDSGIRFDEALNQIGGEDVVFFRELRRRNLTVYCAPQAVVYESIPPGRASLAWLMRRWIRSGATSALIDSRSMGLAARLRIAAGGIVRVAGGGARSGFLLVTRGWRNFAPVARSLATVCRGLGMFMAAFGYTYKEYGRSYRPQPPR